MVAPSLRGSRRGKLVGPLGGFILQLVIGLLAFYSCPPLHERAVVLRHFAIFTLFLVALVPILANASTAQGGYYPFFAKCAKKAASEHDSGNAATAERHKTGETKVA